MEELADIKNDNFFLIILGVLRVPSNQCYRLKREQQEID